LHALVARIFQMLRRASRQAPLTAMTKRGAFLVQHERPRTKGDAPQIDGAVRVATRRPLRAGDIVTVRIDRADAYDLWATA
jgi:ribosomal protein S12 methylthiotransferase